MVSYHTTSLDLVQLLLNCYTNKEDPSHFNLHEVCKHPYTDRPLNPRECPLVVQSEWPKLNKKNFHFVLRRNLAYALSVKQKVSAF